MTPTRRPFSASRLAVAASKVVLPAPRNPPMRTSLTGVKVFLLYLNASAQQHLFMLGVKQQGFRCSDKAGNRPHMDLAFTFFPRGQSLFGSFVQVFYRREVLLQRLVPAGQAIQSVRGYS